MQIQCQKLELHQRQLALAETQFNRPSISVPIILPQDVNHLASRTATLLVSSKNMLYCSHGVLNAWTSATPLYRLAGEASLDEVSSRVQLHLSVSLISVKYHRVVDVFIDTVNSYVDANVCENVISNSHDD